MNDGPVMMIALLCDAGKDTDGTERKSTLFIDQEGHIHDARIGWPEPSEKGFHWGPVMRITGDEWLLHCGIATGSGA